MVDVMAAFAEFGCGLSSGEPTCRPVLLPAGVDGGAVLELQQLWNPCAHASRGGAIVSNDLTLGSRYPLVPSMLHNLLWTIQTCNIIYAFWGEFCKKG